MTTTSPEPAGAADHAAHTPSVSVAKLLRQARQVATDEEAERLDRLRDRLARQRLRF